MTYQNPSLTLDDFANTIDQAGLILTGQPIISGEIIRVPTAGGHNGDKTGWYSLHEISPNLVYGYFGDWRTGENGRWSNCNTQNLPYDQREKLHKIRDQVKARHDKEQAARWKAAASLAAQIWDTGKDILTFPYLIKKKVQAMARVSNDPSHYPGWLMVPLTDKNGYHTTLQFISETGEKRFLSGGKKKGCYHLTDGDQTTIYICEGYATALTISEATGAACAMACDCGNLEPVAHNIRQEYPYSKVIISGDNDHEKPANVGKDKALKAASAVGTSVTLPDCGPGESDYNDIAANHGIEEVKAQLKQVTKPPESGVKIINMETIKMTKIDWLWPGWLAGGKLHILAGQAGTGKTTIALDMAATISNAGAWPDGSTADRGSVLIWSGEDDMADSIKPRLAASNADMTRIKAIGYVTDKDGQRAFDPASDIADLLDKARHIPDLKLIIVDPIVSAIAGDSHKNAEVRRGLQPLVDMAEEIGAAIIGITHFTKGTQGGNPLERVTGSLAFGALARVVMCTAKGTEEGQSRRLVRTKSNIGPDGGGFEYDLTRQDVGGGIEGQTVLWGNALDGTAMTLLSEIENGPVEKSATEEATEWLEELLQDGPLTSKEIKTIASDSGYTWRTIQRVQSKGDKVVTKKTGFGKDIKVIWSLENPALHTRQGYY